MFTDAHTTSSVCTPSRYSLLTGRYNWRTRLQGGVASAKGEPLIAPDRLTLGGLLQEQGYHTAIVGKWHLDYRHATPESLSGVEVSRRTGKRWPAPAPVGAKVVGGPTTRGFDTFYGFHHSRIMSSIVDGDTIVEEIDTVDVLPRLTERAVAYLEERAPAARAGEPFFLYFPQSSPHTPIIPAPAWRGQGKLGGTIPEQDRPVRPALFALCECAPRRCKAPRSCYLGSWRESPSFGGLRQPDRHPPLSRADLSVPVGPTPVFLAGSWW